MLVCILASLSPLRHPGATNWKSPCGIAERDDARRASQAGNCVVGHARNGAFCLSMAFRATRSFRAMAMMATFALPDLAVMAL